MLYYCYYNMATNEEYFSASDEDDNQIGIFDINKNIIDKKNENTFMIKMSFREVPVYTTSWCFNRKINEEKVNEIYDSIKDGYSIPFILQGIYDEKHTHPIAKILIIDGQHRVKAVEKHITDNDILGECNYNVWICIYKVNYSETNNTSTVLDMFKKINNNRIITDDELPDTIIMDLVNSICNIALFKSNKVIGININTNSCHEPRIHKKELNIILNEHKNIIKASSLSIQQLVENIITINHKLCIKASDFKEYFPIKYHNTENEKRKYREAVAKKFFLNLKNSKYPPDVWVKYITYPQNL